MGAAVSAGLQLAGTVLLAAGVALRLYHRGWVGARWRAVRRTLRRLWPFRRKPPVVVGAGPATVSASSQSAGVGQTLPAGSWEDWDHATRTEQLRRRLKQAEQQLQRLNEQSTAEAHKGRDERRELRRGLRAVQDDVADVAVGGAWLEVVGLGLLLAGLGLEALGQLVGWW